MGVAEWMKDALQSARNHIAPLVPLLQNKDREQVVPIDARMDIRVVDSAPYVPCVHYEKQYTEIQGPYQVSIKQFPAHYMAVLDEHYGLSEAGHYQFVLADIYARPEMWAWAEKEAERLIQIKKLS